MSTIMSEILSESLTSVISRIHSSTKESETSENVKLVAVSKRQPIAKLLELQSVWRSEYGELCFGENYVQEFEEKCQQLGAGEFRSHLIGSLQRNKAKKAVALFDVIETVHSLPLAEALSRAALQLDLQQEVYIQVNISGDAAKSGITPGELTEFIEQVLSRCSNLNVCGLMTITRFYENREDVRADFREMKRLHDTVQQHFNFDRFELSMGMSSDFDIAVEEGATVVRVGTALFGERM